MSEYYLAPSLAALFAEVNKAYPKRDRSSDGWIGDPSHAARVSDHNPDWSVPPPRRGVVRAIDVDIDDNDSGRSLAEDLVKACVGDPRVWYVIFNGTIWSRTYGWVARRYIGNPHTGHVHVSIIHTRKAETDTGKWLSSRRKRRKPLRVDLSILRKEMAIALGLEDGEIKERIAVRRAQRVLRRKVAPNLKVDGVAGRATADAWRQWEIRRGVSGRPAMPDEASLRKLLRGTRYRVA